MNTHEIIKIQTKSIWRFSPPPQLSAQARPPSSLPWTTAIGSWQVTGFSSCSSVIYSLQSSLSKLYSCKSDHITVLLKSSSAHHTQQRVFSCSLCSSHSGVLAFPSHTCYFPVGKGFYTGLASSLHPGLCSNISSELTPHHLTQRGLLVTFLPLSHFTFLHDTSMLHTLCYVHICLFIYYSHQPPGYKLHILFTSTFLVL